MNKLYPRLQKFILADEDALTVDVEKCHGSWLVDEDGKERLDLYSQFASQPLGWNCPLVKEQLPRLHKVAEYNIANSDMYTPEYATFVETFASFAPDFKHFFFVAGGALGVENALKAAFDWKARRLSFNEAQLFNLDVLHFKQAFHGRTGYTLSLTNTVPDKTMNFPKFGWSRFDNPKVGDNVEKREKAVIEKMISRLEKNRKIGNGEAYAAAIIIEPIQGEGGDNHFRASFFKDLRKLADTYHAMLIFDEVQTGMGLTGKNWAYEHFGVTPDLVSFGKKAQVCGFMSTDRIDEIKDNVFKVPSRLNSTWGGNLVDMVRSTIYMEIIQKQKFIEQAAITGEYLKIKLANLGLANVRGRGLMIAFDLKNGDERDKFLNRLNEKAVALKCGDKSIRLRPHLTFGNKEADVCSCEGTSERGEVQHATQEFHLRSAPT